MTVIGPTGEFPAGKPLRSGDRGRLAVSLKVLREECEMVLDFGTTLNHLDSTPIEAMTTAALFRAMVSQHFGQLDYDVSGLPFTVKADSGTKMVVTHFPWAASVLVANPEVFLAYAQRLEEEAFKLLAK